MSADPTHFARVYWDTAAETYAQDFTATGIGGTRRLAVWRKLEKAFSPGQLLLELNCGTGIDAVHLAKKGMRLVACDISQRMIELAQQHAVSTHTSDRIDFRVLPNERIDALAGESVFDGAFSNFCGLNCVEDLPAVVRELTRLVKPGAPVLLCIIGRFVPWDLVWFLARGEPRRALRRLQESDFGCDAPGSVGVQRPSVTEMTRLMSPAFRLRSWSGIGIAVPPTYSEQRARHFPRLIKVLAGVDLMVSGLPLFRQLADCVLLEFECVKTAESQG